MVRVVPATPASFLVLNIPATVVFTVAIAKFVNRESSAAGHALAVMSLPFICAVGADPPHALEPALLAVGLLLQAYGKRNGALAFATAACLTKPSMGYLYGLVLLFLIGVELRRQGKLGLAGIARALTPAIVTGLGLIVVLGITFGWVALFHTLLPFTGVRTYQVLHYGGESLASLFYFSGIRPAYYIGTPTAFWLFATLYLVAAAFVAIWRKLKASTALSGSYEIVLTCALLHVGFIGLFYGPPSSWTYYAYIMVMGVAATDAWGAAAAKIVWGLCILAALGNYTLIKSSFVAWKTMHRTSVTAGLFATPAEAAEWVHVTTLVKDQRPALFTWVGNAELLFPWFGKPVGTWIVPGEATDGEVQRKVDQLRAARIIVIPAIPGFSNPITDWPGPEFRTVLYNTKLVFKGEYFEVYERDAPAPNASARPPGGP